MDNNCSYFKSVVILDKFFLSKCSINACESESRLIEHKKIDVNYWSSFGESTRNEKKTKNIQ